MQVISCYAWNSKTTKRNNSNLFPRFLGKSNCGKTNSIVKLVIKIWVVGLRSLVCIW